jgi:SecD/SecF fusion protein
MTAFAASGDPNFPNKSIAIVMDNMVFSAPSVGGPISGGKSQISGSFTAQDAKDLANILNSGKIDAPAKIIQEEVVGPTLRSENYPVWYDISFGRIVIDLSIYVPSI